MRLLETDNTKIINPLKWETEFSECVCDQTNERDLVTNLKNQWDVTGDWTSSTGEK